MAFTAGSAHVNHFEGDRGTLRHGSIVDLVVLDRNPFEKGEPLSKTGVAATFVAGEVVHQA